MFWTARPAVIKGRRILDFSLIGQIKLSARPKVGFLHIVDALVGLPFNAHMRISTRTLNIRRIGQMGTISIDNQGVMISLELGLYDLLKDARAIDIEARPVLCQGTHVKAARLCVFGHIPHAQRDEPRPCQLAKARS